MSFSLLYFFFSFLSPSQFLASTPESLLLVGWSVYVCLYREIRLMCVRMCPALFISSLCMHSTKWTTLVIAVLLYVHRYNSDSVFYKCIYMGMLIDASKDYMVLTVFAVSQLLMFSFGLLFLFVVFFSPFFCVVANLNKLSRVTISP